MGLFDVFKKNRGLNPLRGMMNLGNFKVTGKNQKTNRSKTVTIAAASADDAASISGLADCTVEEIGWGSPSESQVSYLKKSGVSLPAGATARDATALIERLSHGEKSAVSDKMVMEAAAKGISMSLLTGKHQFDRYMEDWERGGRGDNGRT